MSIFHRILLALQAILTLPVNLIEWAWNQPRRGRCLIWGMPAVLILLFVLLVSIWARTGLRAELSNTYIQANQSAQKEIAELEAVVAAANADASLVDAALGESELGGKPKEIETSSNSLSDELAQNAIQQIRRYIQPPRRGPGQDERRCPEFELDLDSDGRIDRLRMSKSSGDPVWDAEVEQGIRDTGRLEFPVEVSIPDSLSLAFDRDEYLLDRQQSAAQVYLRKLIELNPNNLDYKYQLALSFAELGDFERALSLMTQVAPSEKPGLPQGHVWLATQYFTHRFFRDEPPESRLRMAARHLQLALSVDPANFDANYGMAQILVLQKRYAEAEPYLERIFDNTASTRSLGVTRVLLQVYKETNQTDKFNQCLLEVENRLNEFWKNEPDNETFAFDLARVHVWRERYDRAIELLTSRLKENGSEAQVRLRAQLADLYFQWGSTSLRGQTAVTDDALQRFAKALEFQPRHLPTLTQLATMIANQWPGYERAVQIYDPMADDDAPAAVLRELANAHIQSGESDLAIAMLEKSLEKNPNDRVTANNLAFLLLSADPPDAQRALELTERALQNPRFLVQQDPRMLSSLLDTRAAALAKLNQLEEAIALWQRALEFRPGEIKFMQSIRDAALLLNLTELAETMERDIAKAKATQPQPPQKAP